MTMMMTTTMMMIMVIMMIMIMIMTHQVGAVVRFLLLLCTCSIGY